jgi:primosomal protein N' (replication factor Y)
VVAEEVWQLTEPGCGTQPRGERQRAVHDALMRASGGLSSAALDRTVERWRPAATRLLARGVVARQMTPAPLPVPAASGVRGPDVTPEQHAAITAIVDQRGFQPFLLEGVTGSGKTEVYLRAVAGALERDRQALVLAPEIGLTPQLVDRFRKRLHSPVVVLHSALTDRERLAAWQAARDGRAGVIIGTRSAVFTPLARPGLIVVDEEHDASYKQQDGFRYSARDLAVVRARLLDIPVVLGSATPALESLHNVHTGRFQRLSLPERVGGAKQPDFEILDLRGRAMSEGIALDLLQRMRAPLQRGEQVLLFLNRRGYSPTLLCHACGWVARCARCDARMTLHKRRARLVCHHCGGERQVCTRCGDCGSVELRPVGLGTERVESVLGQHLPGYPVARIDRDSTQRKGSLEDYLEGARSGRYPLLVGTQMLAKGHHFPAVTLAAVLDADQGLFSADFRAGERLAQILVQVAGRAGRAERPGSVVIQTHQPGHPLLQTLVSEGYPGFARLALAERADAGLPPFAWQALLRAEATDPEAPSLFLQQARSACQPARGVELMGPVPAPMERRAGRWRAQLLVTSDRRAALHSFLDRWAPLLDELPAARRNRWSLEVDPAELY